MYYQVVMLIVLNAFAVQLFAEDNAMALKNLHSKIGSIEQLSAEFKQISFSKIREKSRERIGKAFFVAPNRFRWIYDAPQKEEFRFDGKGLLIIRPDEKIATRYTGVAAETREIEQIVSMVLDFRSLTDRYNLQTISKTGEMHQLVFVPKSIGGDLQNIEVDVMEPKFLVGRVKMNYESNSTEIIFTNSSKVIPANILDEKIPSDIKIKDLK